MNHNIEAADFFINNARRGAGGPQIFARRLINELEAQGLTHHADSKNRMTLIKGTAEDGKFNILRLDNLYYHNCRANNKIFEAYKAYDHIIFQADFARIQYEKFTGVAKPNSVIHNGVPDPFFNKQNNLLKKTKPALIASGNWRRHKRLEEIVEAFALPKLKNIELWVLNGKGFKGKITDNVKLMPKYPPNDLASIYQSADAMIHLCWLDCCPNSVVEGLASGLPVLCSHNGGTHELVKNDGVIIQLEEDYTPGTYTNIYNPPVVDTDIIANGVLQVLEMPKIKTREDLKISNVALKYKKLFK